jgi:hypothetical protein
MTAGIASLRTTPYFHLVQSLESKVVSGFLDPSPTRRIFCGIHQEIDEQLSYLPCHCSPWLLLSTAIRRE